eukprot:7699976-Heterocapsa_arctica.AAC.1
MRRGRPPRFFSMVNVPSCGMKPYSTPGILFGSTKALGRSRGAMGRSSVSSLITATPLDTNALHQVKVFSTIQNFITAINCTRDHFR